MAPCPSARELINAIKSLTRQDNGTFQNAWKESFLDPYHCCEQGGFIYIDFPVPSRVTRAWITRAPKGDTMNQRTEGRNAAIDLNRPGTSRNNVILVANFHTHPLSERVRGDPHPSRADIINAYYRGVPGFVISRGGIYTYGPERRESIRNPKGYPNPGTPPSHFTSTLLRRAPPPWVVKNLQWPEGTSHVATRATSMEDEINDENSVENDVTYVEWSDEGIVHTESLAEN